MPITLTTIRAAMTFARRLLALAALTCVASCTSLTAESPAAEQAVLERVANGSIVLDCSFLCSHNFIFRQETIFGQYAVGDWRALAVSVTQTNFRMDVAYFLLGSAAQGMGDYAAAIRYFKYAGALSSNAAAVGDHCAGIHICHGINLPGDIYSRIQASEQALAVQAGQQALAARLNDARARTQRAPPPAPAPPTMTQGTQPAASAGAPAEHPAWIDPPPAKR